MSKEAEPVTPMDAMLRVVARLAGNKSSASVIRHDEKSLAKVLGLIQDLQGLNFEKAVKNWCFSNKLFFFLNIYNITFLISLHFTRFA